jgi:predicted MFS family arabinose efflux permease
LTLRQFGNPKDLTVTQKEGDLDRELSELLQELRVMLPGVQVLLAFLLTVPFTQRFVTLSDGERAVYFTAVGLTSLAIVLLMTPGVQHRMRFREHDKEALLEGANRLLIIASVVIGAAILTVVFLLAEYVYGFTAGCIATVALLLVMVWLWYLLPWRRRHDRSGDDLER